MIGFITVAVAILKNFKKAEWVICRPLFLLLLKA
jgi:hypothetical protein